MKSVRPRPALLARAEGANQPLQVHFIVSRDTHTGTYFRYHSLAAGLVRRGHQVTVSSQQCLAEPAGEDTRDGVRYLLAARYRGDSYLEPTNHPLSFLARLRAAQPEADVHHLFQPFENSAALWLRRRRRDLASGAMFVWDWDDLFTGGLLLNHRCKNWSQRLSVALTGWIERSLPRRAHLVTTCSQFLAQRARTAGALDVEVIHNGFTAAPAAARDPLRARFGLPADAFLLGFIGWTPTELDWCLQALERLDERVLLVCCGVPFPPLAEPQRHLASRIRHLGKLTPADAGALMRALDVGLLPLARSPFNESRLPIKLADYLSAGLPVIAAEVGETGVLGRELDGVHLLPPEPAAWAAGCAELVRGALEGRPLVRPSAAQLAARLSWDTLAEQLEAAYDRVGARLARGFVGRPTSSSLST